MSDFNRDQFFLEEWPNALRSGEYKQGTGTLLKEDPDGNSFYCCLGVACDLLEKKGLITSEDWIAEAILPDEIMHILNIESMTRTCLASLNDSGSFSFPKIADIIVSTYKRDKFHPARPITMKNYD